MREALFNILRGDIEGARFLDLFAGTGAIGLEALSRGAAFVAFVEQDRKLRQLLADNIQRLDAGGKSALWAGDARKLAHRGEPFDIIYADPPYEEDCAAQTLENLHRGGYAGAHSLIVFERSSKRPLQLPQGFSSSDQRRYGAGTLEFISLADDAGNLS